MSRSGRRGVPAALFRSERFAPEEEEEEEEEEVAAERMANDGS